MRRSGGLLCIVLTHALFGLAAVLLRIHNLHRLQSLH